jgi:uncharacterized membrane protein
MLSDPVLAILGMAIVTFAIRITGYILADRLPSSGFVAAWMRHIPGAVLASLVAPAIASGGPAELAGTAATALAYLVTRNLFAAMVAGVAIVFIVRTYFGT